MLHFLCGERIVKTQEQCTLLFGSIARKERTETAQVVSINMSPASGTASNSPSNAAGKARWHLSC